MYQRTYAKIDLDAIEHNIDNVLKIIGGKAKLLAVIKADAYGHGAVEVGRLLENKCDFFGVACVEEAIELKNSGITTPILILGSVSPHQFDDVVKNDFRIPVFSLDDAKALSKEAVFRNKNVPFHFCIDTGMSRIGFQATEESADICSEICSLPNIYAEGIFSHFATADESDLTKSVEQQKLFKSFCGMLESRGVKIPIKHLNNSAGIMVFDECFDMVRSGIITYGLYPSDEVDKSLIDIKPALEWVTHISHIKTLPPGREISYGGTYVTDEETVVATIPVGYADGYPRCLSNKGRVLVAGQYADIIGRVCMDQFMVDITGIEGVSIEDEVVLIGKQGNNFISIEEVGNAAHSFNYELACSISRRVPRVYLKNKEIVKTVNYLNE
ncbi:MAG: alanine racemase [Acetobacter sp.]|nr:alanine racemase [Bacteroides sp.]MCM1341824.1 alanine racemase [Acetobacter sp.]MCM1433990.1 alanine racemase [Clostridiales bacterium]